MKALSDQFSVNVTAPINVYHHTHNIPSDFLWKKADEQIYNQIEIITTRQRNGIIRWVRTIMEK